MLIRIFSLISANIRYIIIGRYDKRGDFFIREFSDRFGGGSHTQVSEGHGFSRGDQASGSDHAVGLNDRMVQNYRLDAYEYPVRNGTAVDHRSMSDGNLSPNPGGSRFMRDMDATIVLDICPFADIDEVYISSDRSVEPDA